jgi:putative ABC transport system permease protein
MTDGGSSLDRFLAFRTGSLRINIGIRLRKMGLLQDVLFAVRTFRKRPGPIVLAIVAAALGIGANTAIFSVIRGVLLRPPPYLEPDRLVVIRDSNPAAGTFHQGSSSANFLDWRDQNQVFASMAAFADWVPAALIDGEPEQLMAEHVSANFFSTLGVRPAMGRDFTEQDDQLGRNDVVILSDGFWARCYGRDPAVLGRKILLDNAPYTIVRSYAGKFRSAEHRSVPSPGRAMASARGMDSPEPI